MRTILLPILLIPTLCYAEMHLSGEISSAAIDSSGNPYIIEQTIVIPRGKQVVIREGCVFLFKSYTGITVLGKLFIKGTPEHNVVLTSCNDIVYMPNSEQTARAFDWNGITLASEADTMAMDNFKLSFSTFGIKAQNGKISLKNAVFSGNGQYNFMIRQKLLAVQENVPYSFNVTEESIADAAAVAKQTVVEPLPVKKERHVFRNIIRYTSLTAGIAGLSTGTYYTVKSLQTKKLRDDMHYIAHQALELNKPTQDIWAGLNADYDEQCLYRNITAGLAILGITGFTLTFAF